MVVVALEPLPALAQPLSVAAPVAAANAARGAVGDGAAVDPEVTQAREGRAAAERRRAALTAELDALAAAFEHARAHHERVAGDVEAGRAGIDRAEGTVQTRRDELDSRVAAAYKRPGAGLELAAAVARAHDPATAVHRAALLQRLTARSAVATARAEAVLAGAVDDLRTTQIVGAGAATALGEQQARAEALTAALASADEALAAAGDAVAAAEEGAAEREAERAAERAAHRAAERRRAEAETAAAAAAAAEAAARQPAAAPAGGVPLAAPAPPSVAGKVCPIGAPNGFIDSWGFPRSGGRRHQGIDIFAEHGMPLYAVADGYIRRVWNNRLGGLSIDLVDEAGDRYYYAHLSAAYVVGGQRVRAGDVIGANGNSGNARTTPPHLHWQFHPGDGPPVNPYPLAAQLCR